MRTFRFRLLILFSLLVGARPLDAQPFASASAPERGAELSVYLVTMGNGDQVWEKFGHNAIWIRDPAQGTDWVYNYGVFDFHSPGYWSRFVKGDWLYQLDLASMYQTMAQYQYLNRTVTAQELNLTPAQKAELQDFLQTNYLPENREYLYDYYRDNCSTRIRDAIDRVLGGRIRAATADHSSGTTYRWHSRRLMAGDPVTYTALEAGLGPAADRPITEWEEMFLPAKLQEQVREVRVPGPDGEMVPLVASERVLFQAVGRPVEPAEPPFWVPIYLLIGAAVGAVLVGLGLASRRSGLARFGFSALSVVWTLLIGTGGVLLVALWAFTNHEIAYRNENLFQFNPLALLLMVLLPALAFGARWAAGAARGLALALAVSSLVGLLIQALPWLDQVNGEIIALVLPVHLALAWVVARLAAEVRGHASAPAPAPPARDPGAGHSALGTH